jgi:transcriptional regulator with XRE-family HTH domain
VSEKEQQLHREIGERLKEFRLSRQMNQQIFAKEIHATQGNLSRIERGLRSIDANFLHYLLTAYPRFSLMWLITGKGEMEEQ